jgi:hypothetical protein
MTASCSFCPFVDLGLDGLMGERKDEELAVGRITPRPPASPSSLPTNTVGSTAVPTTTTAIYCTCNATNRTTLN